MKKIFSLTFIFFALIFSGITAKAGTGYGDYVYEVINGTATITWYDHSAIPSSGVVSIPSYMNGYKVTAIDDHVFNAYGMPSSYNRIKKLTLPSTLTTIGEKAFAYAEITTLSIPSSVKTIGAEAFLNCSYLTSITIPNSVTSLGDGAFCGCESATSLSIGTGVTSIGTNTFRYCTKLQNVTLPSNIKTIGDYAFYNCNSLTNISLSSQLTSLGEYVFGNCSVLQSITIPNSVTSIGAYAFRYCTALSEVTVGTGVKSIDEYAFYECSNISKVDIKNIKTWCEIDFGNLISNPFFSKKAALYVNGSLTYEISVPYGTTHIGDYAFIHCYYLWDITLPDTIESIGKYAFYWCKNLSSIDIPKSVKTIGDYAFANSDLRRFEPEEGLISIGNRAFMDAALQVVVLPDSLETIGDYAFYDATMLSYLTIGKGLKSVGAHAFHEYSASERYVYISDLASWCEIDFADELANPLYHYSNLLYLNDTLIEDKLIIPDNVTKIGTYAFANYSKITDVTIPYGVTSIGDYAFYNTYNLDTVTLEDSVTSIGTHTFYGTALTDVYFYGTQDTWNAISLGTYNTPLTDASLHIIAPTVYINYYSNSPAATHQSQAVLANSTTAISVTPPTRVGHKFLGWATSETATAAEYASGSSINIGRQNMDLYAVWEKVNYVTLNISLSDVSYVKVTPYNIPNGSKVILAAYKDNTIVFCEALTVGASDLSYIHSNPYDKIKVFVFDSLNNMKPLTETKISVHDFK